MARFHCDQIWVHVVDHLL